MSERIALFMPLGEQLSAMSILSMSVLEAAVAEYSDIFVFAIFYPICVHVFEPAVDVVHSSPNLYPFAETVAADVIVAFLL